MLRIDHLYQGSVALLKAVVEWHLFEVNLARLPECLLALLLLTGKELCDVSVVTLGHVLVPALLHLIVLHVVNIFHLNTSGYKKMVYQNHFDTKLATRTYFM